MTAHFATGGRLAVLILAALTFPRVSPGAAVAPLELFATSDTERVFEDGYGLPGQQPKEIRVFGLRNETISAQCVVRAQQDLAKLAVSVGPLRREGGTAQLPADTVRWNFVTSVFIEKNTRKVNKADLTRPAPARFPDCLSEDRACTLAKGALKAIYLTVRIPATAEPGDYRGTVSVSAGAAQAALPVVLTVYPLTLPDQRHVMVTEWFSTHHFQRFHGVESAKSDRYWEILRGYAQNMVEHRQNMFRVSLGLVESTLAADGKLRVDFSAFDRFA